jgi:iron(III) transport system substrate-binding protein
MTRCLATAILLFATAAQAQAPADWQQRWNALVAGAKQEGKVVILAPPDQEVREALPGAFKARFGVTVEYIGGRSAESAAKLRAEREAGIYSVDVALSGIQTMSTILYREKMLVPLKPLLVLP